jgi:hypothetical protein
MFLHHKIVSKSRKLICANTRFSIIFALYELSNTTKDLKNAKLDLNIRSNEFPN